jgi:peptidylprolyl isomerase
VEGRAVAPGREAHHIASTGQAVGRYAQVGTFSDHILVSENSLVKVDKDLPLDAVALVSLPDASQAPTVTVTGGPNVDQVATVDLIVGEGAEIASGQQVYIHLLAFRADSGEQLDSTWASGAPLDFVYDSGGLMPGIEQGMAGMKVGGRRQITIPFAEGFGPDGNPQLGLPPSIDLVLVIDLLAAF